MGLVNVKDEAFTMGFDQFNALWRWRGFPSPNGKDGFSDASKRVQDFASDIQKAYDEALGRQTDSVVAAVGQLAHSLPGLFLSPNPQGIAAAQLQVFADFMECAAPPAKTWGEFVQKFNDHCAAFARETAQQLHKQSAAAPAIKEAQKPAIQG